MITSLFALLVFCASTLAVDPVPPTGTHYVGIWPDLSAIDTPAAINARLGLDAPVYQFAQQIPLPAYDYVTGAGGEALFATVDSTNTDAAYYLTVYPENGLQFVTDADLVSLGTQLRRYQEKGRSVYLRFAPEMNGIWMPGYGLQPTAYREMWIRMHTIIKQIAPETVIVWSPNSSYGYPSGATLDSVSDAADRALLDTDGDGQLTAADDAYAPYYPGDEYVDWAGISLYYKGPGFQNLNEAQPGGYCANLLVGNDPFYSETYTNFYNTYCPATRDCMISESGAAYHVDIAGGASQLDIQRAWWQDCITNTTFTNLFPQIKATFMFEHQKTEFDGGVPDLRDFRITNDSIIAAAFQADLEAMPGMFTWATDLAPLQEVATTAPESPVPTATTTLTTEIASLSTEVVYTYTGFSTPLVSGEVAEPTLPGLVPGSAAATLLPPAPTDARLLGVSDATALSSSLAAITLASFTLLALL